MFVGRVCDPSKCGKVKDLSLRKTRPCFISLFTLLRPILKLFFIHAVFHKFIRNRMPDKPFPCIIKRQGKGLGIGSVLNL